MDIQDVMKECVIQKFHEFACEGLNCKQIAERFQSRSHSFGLKMKQILGVYPSVYIARLKKNAKT